MRRDSEPIGGTGLLLLGGGARAAYAVGFLRCLARRLPDGHHFSAILGVSSGAINAAYLASRPGSFQERVQALADLWEGLEPDAVMRAGTLDLLKKVLFWGTRLVGGGTDVIPVPRALVDCEPLRRLLCRELGETGSRDDSIRGLSERLEEGSLRSLLLATTSYTTWWTGSRGTTIWGNVPSVRSVSMSSARHATSRPWPENGSEASRGRSDG